MTEIEAETETTRNSRTGSGRKNRAFLVGCRLNRESEEEVSESLDELSLLVKTAGGIDAGHIRFDVHPIRSATFIGRGQVNRLQESALAANADFIVFDVDLSPTQQRNIEEETGIMVMDRTGVILDIFASRARTKEGKLQVELAQLEYLLPRLRGMWTHLSRQRGGIGLRGPGETDLEIDRRRIQEKITRLKRELDKVRKTRALHRKSRLSVPYSIAVLVGYTNAGKSTLLNRLTDAEVFVEDKLFATLDPTVRELRLPDGARLLLSDTVGFIRKLPHQLVEAFSATFEEIGYADLLLMVVDISHPQAEKHIQTTQSVLEEIGVEEDKILFVFNKADQVLDKASIYPLLRNNPDSILVSAKDGTGLDEFFSALSQRLSAGQVELDLLLPYTAKEALRKINTQTQVLSMEYEPEGIRVKIVTDKKLAHYLSGFQT